MSLHRLFSFPPDLPANLRSNFIHLFWDIGWWGLYMGTTAAFLNIYAARSGATPDQIGLLTAAPALISMVLSLPTGGLLRRFPARLSTATAAFLGRFLFLGFALLPWIVAPALQVKGILVLVILIAPASTVLGISFTQFIMEGVPSEWRGMVVGTRNAIMSIITFVVTMASGQILTHVPFPLGYQIIFFIGFVGGVMTSYHIYHVYPVNQSPAAPPQVIQAIALQRPSLRLRLPSLGAEERNYLKVILILFLFNLTNNMVAPLVPNLLVDKLKLSDATISLGTGAANMLVFSVSLYIARLTRRTGNRNATALGAALLMFNAIALAMAQNAILYIVAAIAGGIASGVLGTAQYNYHLDNVPQNEQATWLSWNLLLGNAAVLLGALVGPLLARLTGTPPALLFLGVLRLVLGLVIFKWG
jgi:MFS family permease